MSLRVIIAGLLVLLVLPETLVGQTRNVDWRIYGTLTVEGVFDLLFYDAADIVQVSKGRFDISVHGLSTPQIESIEADETTRKRLLERAASKAKRGAIIPEWIAKGVGDEQYVDLMVAEEAANAGGVDPILLATYEVDCTEHLIRVLAFAFSQGAKTDSYTHPGGWNPVTPNSNNGMLMRSICKTE